MLFALKDEKLGMLEANFASNICDFLDFLRRARCWFFFPADNMVGVPEHLC